MDGDGKRLPWWQRAFNWVSSHLISLIEQVPANHTRGVQRGEERAVSLRLPSIVVVALGLIGGVLQFLNQKTFGFVHPWDQLITFGLFVIPLFGASVLTGAAFRSALHLSPATTTLVTTLAAALGAAITTFSLSGSAKGILEGVLTFLTFAGFGAAAQTSAAPPAHPAP